MFSLFSPKEKYSLGIDIGTTSIKAVELTREKDRYKLSSYAALLARPSAQDMRTNTRIDVEFMQRPEGDIADMIKSLISAGGFKGMNNAYMSLPAFSSFTTVIDMPMMSEKEVRSSIEFEARQYVPVPLSEVNIDWNIVNHSAKDDQKKPQPKSDVPKPPAPAATAPAPVPRTEVLLVAVPKEIINKYLKIAQFAGIKLASLEVESFSNVRAIIGNDQSSGIVLDIGGQNTNISVVYNGIIYATYNSNVGGNDFTRIIGQSLNVSEQRAEAIKREGGMVGGGQTTDMHVRELLLPLTDKIINDIDRVISIYKHRRPDVNLDKILLTGGGSNLAGVADYIKERTRLDVIETSPFSRIYYAPALDATLNNFGPTLSVACGLAMRGV
ncbi:pilus assembly protein PilM [Patescibacteria group bacterium]|nr:pilus assembly protein PilM [Patescibacteria group bacterium]